MTRTISTVKCYLDADYVNDGIGQANPDPVTPPANPSVLGFEDGWRKSAAIPNF